MKSLWRSLGAAVGVFALLLQLVLVVKEPGTRGVLSGIVNYLSFFTIQTNGLVALAMLLPLAAPASRLGRWFAKPTVRTVLAAYILIVFAVYVVLLRNEWSPQAWDRFADQLLHYVTPAIYLVDWLLFVPRGQVTWRLVPKALAFPILYMGWTLLHGHFANWYPYPFVNVGKLGLDAVLLNGAGLLLVFVIVTAAFVWLDRKLAARRGPDVTALR